MLLCLTVMDQTDKTGNWNENKMFQQIINSDLYSSPSYFEFLINSYLSSRILYHSCSVLINKLFELCELFKMKIFVILLAFYTAVIVGEKINLIIDTDMVILLTMMT